jgi:hypothetical protein
MRGRAWIAAVLVAIGMIGIYAGATGRNVIIVVGLIAASVLFVGLVPYALGFVIQLALRDSVLPRWSIWVGAALLALPSVLWNQPNIMLIGSRWLGVAFGFVLYAMFLDYGARLARTLRQRRSGQPRVGSGSAEA